MNRDDEHWRRRGTATELRKDRPLARLRVCVAEFLGSSRPRYAGKSEIDW